MPHIVGQDDAQKCLKETYDKSELIDQRIHSGFYTGHQLEKAEKFQEKLQKFTDKLNKELDAMIAEENELLA